MCLGLSLGLHGLVLRAPLPPSPPPQLEEPAPSPSTQMAVTVLPKPAPVEPPAPLPEPAPDPPPEPTPPPMAEPDVRAVPPPVAATEPDLPEPALPEPALPEPALPEPALPEPELPPEPDLPPRSYADFPHRDSVPADCGDDADCWVHPGNWRSEATNLANQLAGQGYDVDDITGDQDRVRIYTAAKAGETKYYLYVTSAYSGGTIYRLSETRLTPEEIGVLRSSG